MLLSAVGAALVVVAAPQLTSARSRISMAAVEKAEALLVSKSRAPKLTLAKPPACGIRPLALENADVAHALGAEPILRNVDIEVRRGQR